jgi:hypothetical protein
MHHQPAFEFLFKPGDIIHHLQGTPNIMIPDDVTHWLLTARPLRSRHLVESGLADLMRLAHIDKSIG